MELCIRHICRWLRVGYKVQHCIVYSILKSLLIQSWVWGLHSSSSSLDIELLLVCWCECVFVMELDPVYLVPRTMKKALSTLNGNSVSKKTKTKKERFVIVASYTHRPYTCMLLQKTYTDPPSSWCLVKLFLSICSLGKLLSLGLIREKWWQWHFTCGG